MSDLVPSIIQLTSGLDLSSPKMLAEPGSMIDCLNYELVDFLGYRRISGYARYDGNVCMADIPRAIVYTGLVTISAGTPPSFESNTFFEDADGTITGFLFYGEEVILPGPDQFQATFVSFAGGSQVTANFGTWEFKSSTIDLEEGTITQEQLKAIDSALRGLVAPLPATAVGLQWHRNNLYAVVPQLMIPYEASNNNQVINYTIGATLTTTLGSGTAILRDKIIAVPAGASTPESGWLIVQDLASGSLEALVDDTYVLGGAVTVGVGSVRHQATNLKGMASTACSIYRAQRSSLFNRSKLFVTPGWIEQPQSYTATITLSGITTPLKALRRGSTELESTYYFDDGVDTREAQLLDWYLIAGSYEVGDAVLALQFVYPGGDVTTSFDLYADMAATIKLGDVTTRMTLNYLPGFPALNAASSRYQFKNANFYSSDSTDAIYGANGAGRAFVMGGATAAMSFIYTQADATLDNPRHVENHAYHLALGFQPGSVQLSVVGQPTNFSGLEGASEFGVGDILTGLMTTAGSTLAIFCSSSIHSIVGAVVDSFSLQIIAPKTGCVEYSLADIGEPVYLDARGVCTLATSANYGDFADGRMSTKVSSFLRRKLKKGLIGTNNASGVACAIPVREKNQYRVFFNDGTVLTMTFKGRDAEPGFTLQRYFMYQGEIFNDNVSGTPAVYILQEDGDRIYQENGEFYIILDPAVPPARTRPAMVPFAWTSEVDDGGREYIFTSHYNEDAMSTSDYVYALECGDSFDGTYIPHHTTLNWYFADNPSQFQTLHSIRLHGLSLGVASINVQAAGAQNNLAFGTTALSTTPTPINLPRNPTDIVSEFQPVTNRTDIAARGLAIQLKFSGSNTNFDIIEPSHVAQVLVTYSTPDGAFDL